jgi:hypothetical protein
VDVPVAAESVPTAGERDQEMVPVVPESVAVKGTAAPPAVTVLAVGLTVRVGTDGGLTVIVAVAVSDPAVAVRVTAVAAATFAGGV